MSLWCTWEKCKFYIMKQAENYYVLNCMKWTTNTIIFGLLGKWGAINSTQTLKNVCRCPRILVNWRFLKSSSQATMFSWRSPMINYWPGVKPAEEKEKDTNFSHLIMYLQVWSCIAFACESKHMIAFKSWFLSCRILIGLGPASGWEQEACGS